MKSAIFTEKHVRGWEAIMKRMVTQGHASFRQDGRENRGGERFSEEEWAGMSQAERWEARRTFK
jgi:hypothetical protein